MNDFVNYFENDDIYFIHDEVEEEDFQYSCDFDIQDNFQVNNQDDIIGYNQNHNQNIIHGIPFNISYDNEEKMYQFNNIFPLDIKESNNQMKLDLKLNTNVKNKLHKKPKPYHKRKSTLSEKAQSFREMFFLIFTKKKRFPKTIIWEIHKLIQEPLNLKKINRDIIRDNDKYFENFLSESTKIIQYLQINKDTITTLIPQLKKYE